MKTEVEKKHEELIKQGNRQTIGCLFVLIFIIGSFIFFYNKKSSDNTDSINVNPCLMSEDFIKKDLNYPDEAQFPFLDCNSTNNNDGTYTVLRKISAKNAFGMKKEYIYKVEMRYKGGNSVDISNWELINMKSEESR